MMKNKFTARPTAKELKLTFALSKRAQQAKDHHKLTQHVWNRLRSNTSRRKSEVVFPYKNITERKTILEAVNQISGLTVKTRRFTNSTVRAIVVSGWAE